ASALGWRCACPAGQLACSGTSFDGRSACALRSYTPLVKRCPHTLDKLGVSENYEFVDPPAAGSPPRDVQYPFLMFWFALDADRALPTIDALGSARFELKRQPGGVAVSREVDTVRPFAVFSGWNNLQP